MSCTASPDRVTAPVEATVGPLPLAVTTLRCEAVLDEPLNMSPGVTDDSASGTGGGSGARTGDMDAGGVSDPGLTH